jgi:hypothetical protein
MASGSSSERIAPEDIHTPRMPRFLTLIAPLASTCADALYGSLRSLNILLLNVVRYLRTPFNPFISLQEAEALAARISIADIVVNVHKPPLWRKVSLLLLSALQFLSWLGIGLYDLVINPDVSPGHRMGFLPFLFCTYWLYSIIRSLVRPLSTPPFDLFATYVFYVLLHGLYISMTLYDYYTLESGSLDFVVMSTLVFNFVCGMALSIIVLNMPLGIPSGMIPKDEIVR